MKIVKAVGAGFLVMGAIGYAVKLVSLLRGPEFANQS
jgi:preprotein translocase subunit Sss1